MGLIYNDPDMIKESEYEEILSSVLKQYSIDRDEISMSRLRYFVGRAVRIANNVYKYGGTYDEMKNAVIYVKLCTDARKHGINVKQYYIDHMATLDRKYQVAASK